MIQEFTFPVLKSPGANLAGRIHDLATALAIEGGELKEIWVSRVIYDRLTLELQQMDEFLEKEEKGRWTNGLIVIYTQSGKVKIRRADED